MPVFWAPLINSVSPFSLPVLIASHAYFARINPAPTNASVRNSLKISCISAIRVQRPSVPGAANAGNVSMQMAMVAVSVFLFICFPFCFKTNKETATEIGGLGVCA